jgi:PadR family transcriptional regulator, regulatory protein PadR
MGRDTTSELLPGTLELLILLEVGESSLYPALQRLLLKGWVKAEWGASENNRRARYYKLTAAGRKQMAVEREEFDRVILAIHKVLNAT